MGKNGSSSMINEKSCGAVVFTLNSETNYLLLHYEAGHWDFVKGNVEPNETEKDTVMRELREETSIAAAKFVEGFREKIAYFYRRQGATIHKEVIFFIIEAHTKKVELSAEHIGYDWLDYKHAMERLTFKNARSILQYANEFLKKRGIIKSSD
jgi:8-oxo-dGTP pyrophosphatase MutT (NUDIX family)